MTGFSDERGAEMRDLFFETAQELLQTLNEDVLKLEKAPEDAEAVRSIRRTVHTLKGDSAACGFDELSELAHMLEDALAGSAGPTSVSLVELGFSAADVFHGMLAAYRGERPLPDWSALKESIRALASASPDPAAATKAAARVPWTEYENLAAEAARKIGKKVFHLTIQIDPVCAMPIAARQLVTNALAAVAEILGLRPEDGSQNAAAIDLLLVTFLTPAEIVSRCRIPTVTSGATCVEHNPGAESSGREHAQAAPGPQEPKTAAGAEARVQPAALRNENILRVEAERIDSLLNLVGELVIAKSMMQQSIVEFAQRYPKDNLRACFADAMSFQARVLNDLQRSVMKVRMVPVEQLFRRFPRVLRDVAKRCNKEAQLVISGEKTDLDKSLLDAIAEPLTHIVRNAVSHGIESPAEREKSGKPPVGKISLDAYHQGNQLIVEVQDDGRGIDAARLKARALKSELINSKQAQGMSQQEILDLMFRPGFSTADEVTEISGRGVGLDVVRSVLARLKGTVEVETRIGQGTTFRLKLPLTLAIIKALLFRVEQRLYAIPLNAVAEITRANESELHIVDSCEVLQLRGQALPLVRMGQGRQSGKLFVLMVASGDRKLGLIVDSLEGEEELVIKSLDDHTVATDLVSGASILGDGRVVLIINLAAIQDRFIRREADMLHAGLLLSENERHAHAAAAGGQP
jgi:two-component system chemotaxis sensor kinase CheA